MFACLFVLFVFVGLRFPVVNYYTCDVRTSGLMKSEEKKGKLYKKKKSEHATEELIKMKCDMAIISKTHVEAYKSITVRVLGTTVYALKRL